MPEGYATTKTMDFSFLTDGFFLGCFLAGTFVLLAAATYGGILLAIPFLKKHGCYAVRNASSNHTGQIPHGAGLVVVAVTIVALLVAKVLNLLSLSGFDGIMLYRFADPDGTTLSLTFFVILFFLCLSSFADDLKPKSVVYRLSLQVVAAAFVVTLLPGEVLLGYAPSALDKLFALLFIVTFTNFVNFIDGCDGMCGVQVVAVCLGLVAVSIVVFDTTFSPSVGFSALVLGATTTGFLLLNWQPAKVFLGDAGSVPVGFFLAVLLLLASAHGYWEAAVILPLYCYCDAGITLFKRILRREKFWQPHKKHFYKLALSNGRSHKQVVRATAFVNAFLVVLTLSALRDDHIVYDLVVIAIALMLVGVLLWWMASPPQGQSPVRKKSVGGV